CCCVLYSSFLFCSLFSCRPSCSPLFPYTTLFRSAVALARASRRAAAARPARLASRRVVGDDQRIAVEHGALEARIRTHVFADLQIGRARLNSSHLGISYAVFCLKKKKKKQLN